MLYISTLRPDIQYGVQRLARKATSPTELDMQALRRVTRYLRGASPGAVEIRPLGHHAPVLRAFSDSDWAAEPDRKSVSGMIVCYDGVMLLSGCRKQTCVALSSGEAELYAITACARELLGIRELLTEMSLSFQARLASDAAAARAIASRRGPLVLERVEIRRLAVRDWVAQSRFELHSIPTAINPADALTKWLTQSRLEDLMARVGFILGRQLTTTTTFAPS